MSHWYFLLMQILLHKHYLHDFCRYSSKLLNVYKIYFVSIIFILCGSYSSYALPRLANPDLAESDLWDSVRFYNLEKGKSYQVSSGTGFFVNSNYIVTNEHVVSDCTNIAIRGAVEPTLVKVVAKDKNLDLAILYSQAKTSKAAFLRYDYSDLKIGSEIFVIGYPMDYGQTGKYLMKNTTVFDIQPWNENINFTEIEFANVVDHGNSGGPLLDKNVNVIGVIRARKTYYSYNDPNTVQMETGVAIGLDALVYYLKTNNIIYQTNATYDIFTNYRPDKITKDYLVNIHCIK
jgi:hypothetical protein